MWATYGQLLDAEGKQIAVTLELPWRENRHGVSCIPAGVYPAHRRMSAKRKYELFELDTVPGRSNIEIHIGNLPSDSEGCILLGSAFGILGDKSGILRSGDAFRTFMGLLRDQNAFTLVVSDPLPMAAA